MIYDNSFSIQSFKKHSNYTFINGDLSDYKKLELASNGNVAYIVLSRKELLDHNFKKGDTEGLVNYALSIENVNMAVLIIETFIFQVFLHLIFFKALFELSFNKFVSLNLACLKINFFL